MNVSEAKRLKELEAESTRLKKLLADQLSFVPGLVGLRCVKNCHDHLQMKGVVMVLPILEVQRDPTQSSHLLDCDQVITKDGW